MSDKKDKTHLTDSEKRIIQQGAIRSATRWQRFVFYTGEIDHLPTRVLKVISRYGFSGASRKDIRFFVPEPVKRLNAVLDDFVEKNKIKLVKRGRQKKYIIPINARKAHPRINETLDV